MGLPPRLNQRRGPAVCSHPVDGVAVADDGGVWIVHHGRLSRVDPHTLRITATVGTGRPVTAPGIAAGVWAVCCGDDGTLGPPRLTRIDPAGNRVVASILLPGPADAVGAGLAGVWVRSPGGPVWRVDPFRNRVAGTVKVPGGLGATAGSVLVAGGMVLVSDPDNGAVHVIGGSRVAEGGFEAAGRDVVVDERGTVWVHSDQRVVGFGPDHTRGRTLYGIGGAIRALAAGRDALWVGAPAGLFRVDFGGLR